MPEPLTDLQRQRLGELFFDEYTTDGDSGLDELADTYEDRSVDTDVARAYRDGIDGAFLALCGWKLSTLIERAREVTHD